VLLYWLRESPRAVDKIESIGLGGHFRRISESMGRKVGGMDARRGRQNEVGNRIKRGRPPKKLRIPHRGMQRCCLAIWKLKEVRKIQYLAVPSISYLGLGQVRCPGA
jgi:hypothetical protein